MLNPTDALKVNFVELPEDAEAARIKILGYDTTGTQWQNISVTAWIRELCGMDVSGAVDEDTARENFQYNHCDDCPLYNTEVSAYIENITVSGIDVYIGDDVEIPSSYLCPSYNDGVGEVFYSNDECAAGHRLDYGSGHDCVDVDMIKTTIELTIESDIDGEHCMDEMLLSTQGFYFDGDDFYAEDDTRPILNCYDDGTICWGGNSSATAWTTGLSDYADSPANEDLLSVDTHVDNTTESCEWGHDPDDDQPKEHICRLEDDDKPKAIVFASARFNPKAFLPFVVNGARRNEDLAYFMLDFYPSVAITPDLVLDVWATKQTATNKVLLFYRRPSGNAYIAEFIGEVSPLFNLQPCKSQQQLSSELEAQANTSSPPSSECSNTTQMAQSV